VTSISSDLGLFRKGCPASPSGDGIRDDFYRGRSHLREVGVALSLALNPLPLGLQKVSCRLQLANHFFDFHNRRSSNFLNEWRNVHVSFGRGRRWRLCVNEMAVDGDLFVVGPLTPPAFAKAAIAASRVAS
jgi:hypothetical protein